GPSGGPTGTRGGRPARLGPPAPGAGCATRPATAPSDPRGRGSTERSGRRALHGNRGSGGEVEAGWGAGQEPRLGAGRRVGRAPGRADDRVDVRPSDQRPPVEEEIRQAGLRLLPHPPPRVP